MTGFGGGVSPDCCAEDRNRGADAPLISAIKKKLPNDRHDIQQ
jgi:hypothetical protein